MPRNPKQDANLIPTNKRGDRRYDSMSCCILIKVIPASHTPSTREMKRP